MQKIVKFETAKLAKEKGYANQTPHKLRRDYYNYRGELNGDVIGYIKAFVNKKDVSKLNTIDAPTQADLQDWLWTEHNIWVTVDFLDTKGFYVSVYRVKGSRSVCLYTEYGIEPSDLMELGLVSGLGKVSIK